MLDKQFYDFVSGKRPGVRQFPGTAAAATATDSGSNSCGSSTGGVKFLGFE
jgi:hypothetical protein